MFLKIAQHEQTLYSMKMQKEEKQAQTFLRMTNLTTKLII